MSTLFLPFVMTYRAIQAEDILDWIDQKYPQLKYQSSSFHSTPDIDYLETQISYYNSSTDRVYEFRFQTTEPELFQVPQIWIMLGFLAPDESPKILFTQLMAYSEFKADILRVVDMLVKLII